MSISTPTTAFGNKADFSKGSKMKGKLTRFGHRHATRLAALGLLVMPLIGS